MTMRFCRRLLIPALALMTSVYVAPIAFGQILFVDEFDGTHGNAAFHPGGVVDVTSFRVPFGGTTGDDFVGRTNFRFTLPQDGVSTAASGSADGKVAVLNLDTYNPNAP